MDNIKAAANTATLHFTEAQEIKTTGQSTKRKTGKHKTAKSHSIKDERHCRNEKKIHNYEKLSILDRVVPKSLIISKIPGNNEITESHSLLNTSIENLNKSINKLYSFLDLRKLKKPEVLYNSTTESNESNEFKPVPSAKTTIKPSKKQESHLYKSNHEKYIEYSKAISKNLSDSEMHNIFEMFHRINREADIAFRHFLNSKNLQIKSTDSYRDFKKSNSESSMYETEEFMKHFDEINNTNTIFINIIESCINDNTIFKGRLFKLSVRTDPFTENTTTEIIKLIKTTSLVAEFIHISFSIPMCIHNNYHFPWKEVRLRQLQESVTTLMMLISERASQLIELPPEKIISEMSSIFTEFSDSKQAAFTFMGDAHLFEYKNGIDYLHAINEFFVKKNIDKDESTIELIKIMINRYSSMSFAYILNNNPLRAYSTIRSLKEILTHILNDQSLKADSELLRACRLRGFLPVCQILIIQLDSYYNNYKISQKALKDNQLKAVHEATALTVESNITTQETLNDKSIIQYTILTKELSTLIDIFKLRNTDLPNKNIIDLIEHLIEYIQNPELNHSYESMRLLSHAEKTIKKITSIRSKILKIEEENHLKLSKSADDNCSAFIKEIEGETKTAKQKNKKIKKQKPSIDNDKRKQHAEESLPATSSISQKENEEIHPELKKILSAIDLRTIDSSCIDRLKELLENTKKAKNPNIIHIASVEFSLADLLIHDINNDCKNTKSTEEINITLNDYYAKLKEYSEISKDENDKFFSAIRELITLSSIFSEKFDHVLSAYQNYLEFYSKNYSRLTRELQDISSIKNSFSKINKSFKNVFELIPFTIKIYKFRYDYLCKIKGTESIKPSELGKIRQGQIKTLEDKEKKLKEISLSNNYLMIGNPSEISTSSGQATSKSDIGDDSFSEEIRNNLRNTGLILPESLSESLSEFWKYCKTKGTDGIKIEAKKLEQKTPLISAKWGIESLFENHISNIIYDKEHSIAEGFPRDEWIERHQNRQLFTKNMQQVSDILKPSTEGKPSADYLFDWDMLVLSDALSLPLRCLVDSHSFKYYYPGFPHNQSGVLDFSYKQEDDARLGVHFDFFDGKFQAVAILGEKPIYPSE